MHVMGFRILNIDRSPHRPIDVCLVLTGPVVERVQVLSWRESSFRMDNTSFDPRLMWPADECRKRLASTSGNFGLDVKNRVEHVVELLFKCGGLILFYGTSEAMYTMKERYQRCF